MTQHFALVVEWWTPDDADQPQAAAALQAVLDKIRPALNDLHADVPNLLDRVTAYTDVSADLIAEAASTGAIADQATRLQLAPGDVVTIRPQSGLRDYTAQEFHEYCKLAKAAFPDHRVVVLEGDATIETGPPAT